MEEESVKVGEGGEEAAISGDITVTHGAVMGLEWLISETVSKGSWEPKVE